MARLTLRTRSLLCNRFLVSWGGNTRAGAPAATRRAAALVSSMNPSHGTAASARHAARPGGMVGGR
jgi:hypothetical protein